MLSHVMTHLTIYVLCFCHLTLITRIILWYITIFSPMVNINVSPETPRHPGLPARDPGTRGTLRGDGIARRRGRLWARSHQVRGGCRGWIAGDSEKPWKKPWETAGKMWKHCEKCGKMWKTCGKMWENVEQMWKTVETCRKYWDFINIKVDFWRNISEWKWEPLNFTCQYWTCAQLIWFTSGDMEFDHSKVGYHQQDWNSWTEDFSEKGDWTWKKHISEISLRRGVVENNYGVIPFGNLTYSYGVNGPFADDFPKL